MRNLFSIFSRSWSVCNGKLYKMSGTSVSSVLIILHFSRIRFCRVSMVFNFNSMFISFRTTKVWKSVHYKIYNAVKLYISDFKNFVKKFAIIFLQLLKLFHGLESFLQNLNEISEKCSIILVYKVTF